MKKQIARAAFISLGVLLACLVIEIGLRATGWFLLRSRSREIQTLIPPDAIRLLFIGESTTYGLFVRVEEAYPARVGKILERQLNRPVVVFNRGVPSLTSASMLGSLPTKLSTLHPDAVIFLLGTNDYHTAYNGVRMLGENWLPNSVGIRLQRLKIVRCIDLFLLKRDFRTHYAKSLWLNERGPRGVTLEEPEVFFEQNVGRHLLYSDPEDKIAIAEATKRLDNHFREMIRLCKNHGSAVVVAGYLTGYKENRILKNIADSCSVLFAATWNDPAKNPPNEFLTKDKFHPSAAGHNFMAEKIAPVVRKALAHK